MRQRVGVTDFTASAGPARLNFSGPQRYTGSGRYLVDVWYEERYRPAPVWQFEFIPDRCERRPESWPWCWDPGLRQAYAGMMEYFGIVIPQRWHTKPSSFRRRIHRHSGAGRNLVPIANRSRGIVDSTWIVCGS